MKKASVNNMLQFVYKVGQRKCLCERVFLLVYAKNNKDNKGCHQGGKLDGWGVSWRILPGHFYTC